MDEAFIKKMFADWGEYIKRETLSVSLLPGEPLDKDDVITDDLVVDGITIRLYIKKAGSEEV